MEWPITNSPTISTRRSRPVRAHPDRRFRRGFGAYHAALFSQRSANFREGCGLRPHNGHANGLIALVGGSRLYLLTISLAPSHENIPQPEWHPRDFAGFVEDFPLLLLQVRQAEPSNHRAHQVRTLGSPPKASWTIWIRSSSMSTERNARSAYPPVQRISLLRMRVRKDSALWANL